MSTIIFGVVGIFGVVLTAIVFIVDFKRITSFFSSIFNKHNVFVYGPRAAGKSTLISYLDTGAFSSVRSPTKVESSKNVATNLSGSSYERLIFKKIVEVGGEFVEQLKPEFQKLSPEGIIFLYDLNDIKEAKQRLGIFLDEIGSLLEGCLIETTKVVAFLIIANKADQIAKFDYGSTYSEVELELQSEIEKLRRLFINVEVIHEVGSLRNSSLRSNIDDGIRQLALKMRSK